MSLKNSARQVLEILEAGHYTNDAGQSVEIAGAQQVALQGTRLYTPSELQGLSHSRPGSSTTKVEVIDATTQAAAQDLATEGPVALLNFASARNPGGGFLNGAKAQEEDLCRCSGLYATLLTQPTYYEANRQQSSLLYTDHAIYSPEVPFFKVRGRGPFLPAPFLASVITMPAPNTGPFLRGNPEGHAELEAAFAQRWRCVLAIAADNNCKTLLLGAWGCGAFGGDPLMASETVAEVIASKTAVPRVVFAIPNSGKQGTRNFETFRDRLG